MAKFIKERLILFISLLIITPVGFYTKFYSGPYYKLVNNKICDVFYVTFWILIFKVIYSKIKNIKLTIIIFIVTSIIEFLQLWHPSFLEYLRSFFWGRTLLGVQFTYSDFLYYFIGAIAGYLILTYQDYKLRKI